MSREVRDRGTGMRLTERIRKLAEAGDSFATTIHRATVS